MARGDMGFKSMDLGARPEILNRYDFQAVPVTIDFTSVSTTDPDTKEKVVKAGTPVTAAGASVKTTPWTGAVGILLDDVYESYPQGSMLKRAFIHTGRAQTNSGLTYDAALVAALINAGCNIIFEEPAVAGTIPGAASAGVGG